MADKNMRLNLMIDAVNRTKPATDEVLTGLKRLESGINSVSRAADKMVSMGMQLGMVGAAISAAAIFPIKAAADFERQLSKVKAVTAGATDNFKLLKDTAADLGRTTRYTAVEAAQGMTFLGMAGMDAIDVVKAIGPALRLAAAGGLELAEAADIATNVLKTFGLTTDQLVHVTDVLANTATSANTDVRQLAEAVKYAGAAAAAAGVSLDTTAAIIGVLGNAGIQATMAGTGMRSMLIALASPTSQAQKTLKKLGVEVKKNNDGSIDLVGTLERLYDANMDLGDAVTIFRRTAAGAALITSKNTEAVRELTKANEDAIDTTEDMATIMEDNLVGALILLKSAVMGLAQAVGDPLLAPLKLVVNEITTLVSKMAEWAESNSALVGTITALVGGLGILMTSTGAAFLAVGLLLKVTMSLGLAFIGFGRAAPIAIRGLKAFVTATNVTIASVGRLGRSLVALEAVWAVVQVYHAVRAFMAWRTAANEAADAFDRLSKSSKTMMERFEHAKDIRIPILTGEETPEQIDALYQHISESIARVTAELGELAARAGKETFFGKETKDAKAAKEEIKGVEKKLKDLLAWRAKLGAKRTIFSEEDAAKTKAAVDAEADLQKMLAKMTEDAETRRIKAMGFSEEQIDAMRARELAKFLATNEAKIADEDTTQAIIAQINGKYEEQYEILYEKKADAARKATDESIKQLEREVEEGVRLGARKFELWQEFEAETRNMQVDNMEEGMDKIRAQQHIEMEEAKAFAEEKELSATALQERVAEIQDKYANQMIDLNKAKNKKIKDDEAKALALRRQMWEDASDRMVETFTNMYELTGKKSKAFFYLTKAVAMASVVVRTIDAAALAMEQLGVWGFPVAALITAQGMARLAVIRAQNLAEGGLVTGKKGKDKIQAWLSDKEYVMNPKAVQHYGVGFMEAVNRGLLNLRDFAFPSMPVTRGRGAFQAGGLAAAAPAGGDTIIANFVDPALFEDFLYSARGQNAQINVIGMRAETIKRKLR